MIKIEPLQILLGAIISGVFWGLTQLGLWAYPELGKILDNIPGKVVLSVLIVLLLLLLLVFAVAFHQHKKLKDIELKEDLYHILEFDEMYSLWKDPEGAYYCPYCLESNELKSKIASKKFQWEAYCQICEKSYHSPSYRFKDCL